LPLVEQDRLGQTAERRVGIAGECPRFVLAVQPDKRLCPPRGCGRLAAGPWPEEDQAGELIEKIIKQGIDETLSV